ncbi:MAG: hypothetical protein ABIA04_10365 [Pseudomonadota bacterium]
MVSLQSSFIILKNYVKDFMSFTKYRILILFFMSLFTGLSQGLSFYMLIPMFKVLNLGGSGDVNGLNEAGKYI